MRIRLQRLRAFGLRGRIVGAVLVTTVVTLGVAAVVLLPQLEQALRDASQTSLRNDLHGARAEVSALAKVDYRVATDLTIRQLRGTTLDRAARTAEQRLQDDLTQLRQRLGTDDVYLIGYVDASGHGRPVGLLPSTPSGIGAGATAGSFAGSAPDAAYTDAVADALAADNFDDVAAAFFHTTHFTAYLSFGQVAGAQVVRAAIPLPDDAVLAVRKSIDQIPAAVRAVDHAFEVAALAGLLLTALLAIPLAATLVRRLQRLREAAQRVAEEGAGAEVPTDRARDEVGDLARSFAIMQRRLVHQEEARRAFVATASHELRTPLASLEGMLELVA
jgi:HAMP domain-containing protein